MVSIPVLNKQRDADIQSAPQFMSQASHCSRLTFARLDALDPSVLKPGVAGISALVEPSAAANTTTAFAGFVGAALGTSGDRLTGRAYEPGGSDNRRHRFCGKGNISMCD